MQKLSTAHSTPKALRALDHLSIRLRSRPKSQPLAQEIAQAHDALEQKHLAWRKLQRERAAATGEVQYLDGTLDEAVSRFVKKLRSDIPDDTDPRFVALFPVAPSAAMRDLATPAQRRFVQTLIHQLQNDPSLADYAPHAATFAGLQDQLDQALAARDTIQQQIELAASARRVQHAAACDLYNQAYHQLQLLFLKEPRLVESFFLSLQDAPDQGEEDPDDNL